MLDIGSNEAECVRRTCGLNLSSDVHREFVVRSVRNRVGFWLLVHLQLHANPVLGHLVALLSVAGGLMANAQRARRNRRAKRRPPQRPPYVVVRPLLGQEDQGSASSGSGV